ncbi:MAG: hypothetical protein ACLFPA_11330 [Dichotomicrobium sp.]
MRPLKTHIELYPRLRRDATEAEVVALLKADGITDPTRIRRYLAGRRQVICKHNETR